MTAMIDAQVTAMKKYTTAIVTDGLKRLGVREAWAKGIHPISKSARTFAGRAVVLKYAPIGEEIPKPGLPGAFAIINGCRPGDVLVYAACGVDAWLIGDNVINMAIHRQLGSVVVDGAARDFEALVDLDFPSFARGPSASPYSLEIQLVSVDSPARISGAKVVPGDIVVGDSDGVVVVPADLVDDLLFELEHLADADAKLGEAVLADADLEELNRLTVLKGQKRPKPETDA